VATETSRAYRAILAILRLIVRAFFRRVTVTGLADVPPKGGGIVVSWHPNGLIDPGLVLTTFPRQVVFGARHGIFKWPLLGWLMREIGTVPIYRATDLPDADPATRAAANQKSLAALAKEIARGSFSALFPEGVSHDAPHLMELKTGAARLYYQACALQAESDPGAPPPVILPVGLHYDDKDLFRSNAMTEYFPPLELPPELAYRPDIDEAASREQVRALTAEIERVLHDVVLATESWELHNLMQRTRRLIRAERARRAGAAPGRTKIDERVLGFARIRTGYDALKHDRPEEVAAMVARVDAYDDDLEALGLHDHELDQPPPIRVGALVVLFLQAVLVFLLMPPTLVIGYLVNGPAALVLIALARSFSKLKKDEATIKVLFGAILFPLSWAAAGVAAAYGSSALAAAYPWWPHSSVAVGLGVAALSALGGAAALRYLVMARGTWRAVRVRFTRRLQARSIDRLLAARAALHDELLAMVEGIELPGQVLSDGRVARAPREG
jgi:1-acyl-sn-glycerol-3-phosphate acyltransferase